MAGPKQDGPRQAWHRIPHDLKVYPGAKHSFFNDQWRNYHAAAAADSWQRVLAFFAEHVRGSPAAVGVKSTETQGSAVS
jgi:dienelactone hydrolase